MSLPSRSEQANVIKKLLRSEKLVPGEKAYVISVSWLTKWRKGVGFAENTRPGGMIPPIDNNSLLVNGILKKSLIESYDFEIFSRNIWSTYFKWYGGGPEITVDVAYDPIRKQNVAVLKFSKISIIFNNTKREFQISKYKTVNELRKMACERFQIGTEGYSLYDTWNGKKDQPLEPTKTLSELFINDGRVLTLDIIQTNLPLNANQGSKGNLMAVQTKTIAAGRNSSLPLKKRQAQKKQLVQNDSFKNSTGPASKKRNVPGECGLINLGNTSYINSVLQCLSHTTPFLSYLMTTNLSQGNLEHTDVIESLSTVLNELWSGQNSIYAPRQFKTLFTNTFTAFGKDKPHDAFLFLATLLNQLHNELNIADDTPLIPAYVDQEYEEEHGRQVWQLYQNHNDSIISKTFSGMCKANYKCPICHREKIGFEPFNILSVPMPGNQSRTPSFVFVPFDPKMPKVRMELSLPFGYTRELFTEIINTELGRTFEIAFAIRTSGIDGDYTWYQGLPQIRNGNDMYVFEIPDKTKIYAICCLAAYIPGFMFDTKRILSEPILLQLPGESPTQEELIQACNKTFEYLWEDSESRQDFRVTPDLLELVTTMRQLSEPSIRVMPEINAYWDRSFVFPRSDKLPFITTKTINVLLNPIFMKDNYGFNWSRIKRGFSTAEDLTEADHLTSASLQNCIRQFSIPTPIDDQNKWTCPNCKQAVAAVKSMSLWNLPNVLVVHFKRFSKSFHEITKIETNVTYPDTLDLTKFVAGPRDQPLIYNLYAVTEHTGDLAEGQYTAHVFHANKQSWIHFEDANFKEVEDESEVHNADAYILFYKRSEN